VTIPVLDLDSSSSDSPGMGNMTASPTNANDAARVLEDGGKWKALVDSAEIYGNTNFPWKTSELRLRRS
jgi:hypothetical protein